MSDQMKYASYPSLVDRVVVISGGASGIGGAMTEAFAAQGARVIVLDILQDEAAELSRKIQTHGAKHSISYYQCDVTGIENNLRPTAARILEENPAIHVVINNAAHDTRIPTLDITPEQWDQGLDVNLKHQFFLTQALMPGLVAAGASSVINMGSITWARGGTGLVPYVASKAAVVGLTKTLAREFGPRGVRVNSIMPGAVATERQKETVLTPDTMAYIMDHQAIKVVLQPGDIARMALWLAADDSSGLTNQSIVVDAGWLH